MDTPNLTTADRLCKGRGTKCENRSVRKQYHFWPGAEGLDAWDVDRLVELSRSPNADTTAALADSARFRLATAMIGAPPTEKRPWRADFW